jgi:tetratricopeptide (TPR) repeat protein
MSGGRLEGDALDRFWDALVDPSGSDPRQVRRESGEAIDDSNLSEDLNHAMLGRPIAARPLGVLGKSWRWCRRNPSLATTLGLFLVSLVVGTMISTAMWRISEANAQRANEQLAIAEEAKTMAEQEMENAAAVTRFFTNDVLGQASPNASPDREVKLTAVLDAAAGTLEDQFQDQPLIEAAVRQALGDTYMSLGKLTECRNHLERAVELKSETLGEDHPDTIDAMHKVGMFYYTNGSYRDAELQFANVIQISRRALGNNDPRTLSAQGQRAHALYWQHRYGEAEPIYAEVLKQQEAQDEAPLSALVTRNNLAILYLATDRSYEAESLLVKNLEAQRRELGDTHLDTMTSLNNLGYMYCGRGEFEKAMPYFQESLTLRRRVLGDHPHTGFSIHNLGLLHWLQGQHEESLPYFQEAYEMRMRVSGEDHPNTQVSQRRLCDVLLELERPQEALPYAGRALAWTTKHTARQWMHDFAKSLRGAALAGAGDYVEGEPLLVDGVRALLDRRSDIDRMERERILDSSVARLVKMYQEWGKPEEVARWQRSLETQEERLSDAP